MEEQLDRLAAFLRQTEVLRQHGPDAVGVHVAGEEDAAEQGRGDAAAAECGAVEQPAAVQHGLLDGIDGGIAAPEPGTADKGRQRLGRDAQMLDREMVVGKDMQQRPEDQRDHVGVLVAVDAQGRPGGEEGGIGEELALQFPVELGGKGPAPGRQREPQQPGEGVAEAAVRPDEQRDLRSGRKGFALHKVEVDSQLQPGRAQRGDGFFQRTVGHDADAVQAAVGLAVPDEGIAMGGHAVVIGVKIEDGRFSHLHRSPLPPG